MPGQCRPGCPAPTGGALPAPVPQHPSGGDPRGPPAPAQSRPRHSAPARSAARLAGRGWAREAAADGGGAPAWGPTGPGRWGGRAGASAQLGSLAWAEAWRLPGLDRPGPPSRSTAWARCARRGRRGWAGRPRVGTRAASGGYAGARSGCAPTALMAVPGSPTGDWPCTRPGGWRSRALRPRASPGWRRRGRRVSGRPRVARGGALGPRRPAWRRGAPCVTRGRAVAGSRSGPPRDTRHGSTVVGALASCSGGRCSPGLEGRGHADRSHACCQRSMAPTPPPLVVRHAGARSPTRAAPHACVAAQRARRPAAPLPSSASADQPRASLWPQTTPRATHHQSFQACAALTVSGEQARADCATHPFATHPDTG